MTRRLLLGVGGAACAALATLAAQTPPAQAPPVFTKRVDLVQLDVSVLGKDRLPVRGLTAADFMVKEDGTPQTVVALQEIDMDDPPPPPVAWMRDVTPDVTTNQQEDVRLVVIVIDDALIPMDPFIIKNAKATIAKVIDKLGPRDKTAIVFTADTRRNQDFTRDRAALLACLDTFSVGWATWKFGADTQGAGPNTDETYYFRSVRTLRGIADALMVVPNRRKALIWVSPGVPLDPEARVGRRNAPVIPGGGAAGAPASPPLHDPSLWDEMGELFRQAQRANVAIYPVDVTGFGGLEEYIAQAVFPLYREAGRAVAHKEATLSFDFVEAAAANTGGHAIVNTNDPLPGIDQIFAENSSYYLLGFQPLNAKEDGTSRRIEVKVDRPGVEVRTRSSYYAPKPEPPPKTAKGAPMSAENVVLAGAIGGLLPAPDLPLGVTMAPFAVPGQHTVAVAIALGVKQPVPAEAAKAKITETTELQISAFTPEGQPRGTQRSTAHVVMRAGATGEAQYEVLGRIDLAPGRYSLRLAAHNATSRKTGSVAANLIVPDFTNDPFSISGIAVSHTPAKVTAPKDLLASVLPIVPTSEREFAGGDSAEAFLRLYQSGKKPIGDASLVIRVANDHGGNDASETRTISVAQFATAEPPATNAGIGPMSGSARMAAGRADKPDPFANQWLRTADVRYQIPLEKLSRGSHLLTFEATLGTTTIRRDVRFSVK